MAAKYIIYIYISLSLSLYSPLNPDLAPIYTMGLQILEAVQRWRYCFCCCCYCFTVHLKFLQVESGQIKLTLAPAQKCDDIFTRPRPRIRTYTINIQKKEKERKGNWD